MRFTLSSTALNNRLISLSKVINSKSSLQILNCILFQVTGDKLTITASDNENVMQSIIELEMAEGEGQFAIASHTILDAMKDLAEQPVTFNVDLDMLTVTISHQSGEYNFTAQNADGFPLPQKMGDNATTLTISSNVLADNISRSLFATAQEEIRPVMNGIYFDLTPDSLTIVATDGHKLVRSRNFNIKSEAPASFILPKKPANLLKNTLEKNDSEVTIKFDSQAAEIEFENGTLNCRLIEGRYPNYNSVIPTDNPNLITIDSKALMAALRHVLPFASESSQLVKLKVDANALELNSEDIDFATSAKESIPCEFVGQPLMIGFKGSSLLEILSNIGSDEIVIQLADPSRAGIIVPAIQPEDQNILMLIMPMLLND